MQTINATQQLVKTYTDRMYRHTTMVNHKGTVIAFAMDDARNIYYAVLDTAQQDKGYLDVNYWPEDPKPLLYPNEVEQVGYSIAGATPMPLVKKGSRLEAEPGEIQLEEMDPFLSTTARLTADAAFQVMSDNKYIYVFRQSIAVEHEDMVFKLASGGASGNSGLDNSGYVLHQGEKVPLVNQTLLCDRFILAGSELRTKMETRYRRSRHKTRPAGATDTMAAKDMNGNPFFEPTQELAFIHNMQGGQFSVLQLPTQVSGVKRWQIFAHNYATERIDSFNLEVSSDGLFNPAGTQLYTSPDATYKDAVLEREPGACPFTKRPLVPLIAQRTFAESALKLDSQKKQAISCGTGDGLAPESVTIEAWINPETTSGFQYIARRYHFSTKLVSIFPVIYEKGFWLGITDGFLRFSVNNRSDGLHHWAGSTEITVPTNIWTHVAASWNAASGRVSVYINGSQAGYYDSGVQQPIAYDGRTPFYISGPTGDGYHFNGLIDEVRLWNRALDADELQTAMNVRLIGDEPGLVGYWRLDEGNGQRVYDQTANANHGTLLNNPSWVMSDAPVGDHPGIRRSSFGLEGGLLRGDLVETSADAVLPAGGLAATLYYEQEDTIVGYNHQAKPMKKNARVMLAMVDQAKSIATLDLAISREGRLAQVPDTLSLPTLDKERDDANTAKAKDVQAEIRTLTTEMNALNAEITDLDAQLAVIPQKEAERASLEQQMKDTETVLAREQKNPLNYYCRIESVKLGGAGRVCIQHYNSHDITFGAVHSLAEKWLAWKLIPEGNGYRIQSQGNSNDYIHRKSNSDVGLAGRQERNQIWKIIRIGDTYQIQNSSRYIAAGTKMMFDTRGGFFTESIIKLVDIARGNEVLWKLIPINKEPVNDVIPQARTRLDDLQKLRQEANAALEELYLLGDRREEKERDLVRKLLAIGEKRSELLLLTGQQNDIALPMSHIHTDPQGLTVRGGLLKFARTALAPTFFASATGHLNLYYRDKEHGFIATYFDTKVARATFVLGSGTETITFVARAAGTHMEETNITVSNGQDAQTCTLKIHNPTLELTETWQGLPRDPQQLAEIVNGQISRPDNVTASITPETYSLVHGSSQVLILADRAEKLVTNGTAMKQGAGIDSQWRSDAPGQTYNFDGQANLVSTAEAAKLSGWSKDSDLTVEAWVSPRPGAQQMRLLHYHGEESAYMLTLEQAGTDEFYLVAGVSTGQSQNHIGERFVRAKNPMGVGWTHLAFTFSQSYALQFDGRNYLNAGRSETLNLGDDLTLELFLKLDRLGEVHGLLSKGQEGHDEERVPYQLTVERDGRLCFAFENDKGVKFQYYSTTSLEAGRFHRIAITRKKSLTTVAPPTVTDIQSVMGDKEFKDLTNEDLAGLAPTPSTKLNEWMAICFYIDGQEAGAERYDGSLPVGNTGNLEIGRVVTAQTQAMGIVGTISELRLWNVARNADQVSVDIKGYEAGLIHWWQLQENQGNRALDSKGDSHAKIQGAQWVNTPDPESSSFCLYINGIRVSTETLNSTSSIMQNAWGDLQFSLGGYQSENKPQQLLSGMLEEIRIWRTIRTPEQLLDNLFARLKGERQDLVAYYTFDKASTEEYASKLHDEGLRGLHLALPQGDRRPQTLLSTAPVSNDAAMIRSALSGVYTSFHEQIDNTPAAQEYGDLQRDSRGNATGVMKRSYSYLQNGLWTLFTGYKVGNLVSEWIGQANFNPQIIGYVEGVPPVPSENLTDGAISVELHNYSFIGQLSNIELTESESVSYSLASSAEESVDASFDAAAKINAGAQTMLLTAPFGFGVSVEVEVDVTYGTRGHFEGSAGWANEESFGSTTNKSQEISVELGGVWEDPNPAKQLNHTLGRRLLANNTGFALVQSETADIFALRLAHNQALVSFRMMPNPDIPKDRNIIPFAINPRYVKQGTLDGRVGYDEQGSPVMDPDYAGASGYGEYSFFKPREAYALKRRIQKKAQALTNFYENADTDYKSVSSQIVGAASKAATGLLAGASPSVAEGIQEVSDKAQAFQSNKGLPEQFSKRDIADTYIWTADGGFYGESTEVSDIRTESTSGSFSFNGAVGGTLDVDISILGVGIGLEFDAALGGGYSTSRTRDKESETSFGMKIDHDVPGDLQHYYRNEAGELVRKYDEEGNAINGVGKVDAYRWMSFYLDSTVENFEDLFHKVIDPIWLAESDHPNAIAMRQAYQAEQKPACWRVLHRVTFVSRILPEFSDKTAASPLEVAMRAENLESNWQLIRKLEPFVKNKVADKVAFANATRKALQDYLPELVPHSTEVIEYLKLYYGMEE